MADKKIKQKEPKLLFEREYIVPLRSEWLKVAEFKRANKATKALKQFLVRHMKIYDRDLRKIKIDNILNNEIRFRGMRNPPSKIKVRAKKYDNDIVRVELIDLPEHIKFAKLRAEKIEKKIKKEEKKETKDQEVKTEEAEKKEEAKQKEEASKEQELEISKEAAKEQKHTSKIEKPETKNIGYKRAQRGR